MTTSILKYTGKKQPTQEDREVATSKGRKKLSPYLTTEELVEAVNLAIYLERPLLLRGEPGCGKTRLAQAVAFELNLPYEEWYVKSTSRAIDGLYAYDAVGRLRDAQLAAVSRRRQVLNNRLDINKYIRLGPLGRAFAADQQTVVLIDEIDKADIDFPNDLLEVLEEQSFTVEETGRVIKANKAPVIIITSNDEKELPDAFLRRCLFHYITFPDDELLVKILYTHFGGPPAELLNKAIQRFLELRRRMEADEIGRVKKVSTSELIDWFRVLIREPDDALAKLEEGPTYPYQSTLIKRQEDEEYLTSPKKEKTSE